MAEVYETRGLHLVLQRPLPEQKEQVREKARGVWRVLRAVENTSIPFDLFDKYALDLPMQTFARGYRLSFLSKLPIYYFLMAYAVVPLGSAAENWAVGQRVQMQELNHAADYDFLYKYDVRFAPLQEIKLDQEKIRAATIGWRIAETEYFAEVPNDNLADYREFVDHPLFVGLRPFVDRGLTAEPGFLILPGHEGKVPEQILNKLYLQEHHLQIELEAILQSYLKDQLVRLDQQAALAPYLNDPFWREIRARKLSPAETLHWLQTDLNWRSRFRQWELLGEVRLSFDDVLGWTSTPLTLEEIHNEIRHQI